MSYVISGNATWYDLCCGGARQSQTCGGKCGTCVDGWAHMAWPEYADACSAPCAAQCVLTCDQVIQVQDQCTGVLRNVRAVDCVQIAFEAAGCNACPRCGGAFACSRPEFNVPRADLTTAMFLDLHGSLDDGRIEVQFVCP